MTASADQPNSTQTLPCPAGNAVNDAARCAKDWQQTTIPTAAACLR